MRIAIATFWDTPVNYGQVLQGYALEKALQDMGHESFIIRYTMKEEVLNDSIRMKIMRVLRGERTLSQLFRRFTSRGQYTSERGFMAFKERNMRYSTRIYDSFDDIAADIPQADIYVTGSDQIWGAWGSDKKKRVFLLDFLPDNARRMSYGASFGRSSLTSMEEPYFRRCLGRYSAISVREQQGKDICRGLGLDANVVVDPTLLLDSEAWVCHLELNGLNSKHAKKAYVFIYSVTNDESNKRLYQYIDYFKKTGHDVIYVSSTNYLDKKATFEPTIEEWLWHIKNASLVLTNSFHGVAFSLNFNTPFIALTKGTKTSGEDTRLLSLLNITKTGNRLMAEFDKIKVETVKNRNIEWGYVNSILGQERADSLSFLSQSISNCLKY